MAQGLPVVASEAELVEAARAGSKDAFAELYDRYFDQVYDFVVRMTRNRDEAADLAQDTFLKAMNAIAGLQKGTSFKSWIFTIARNTTLNRLERASRTRPLVTQDEEGEEIEFDVVDTDRFADPGEAAQASAVATLVWEAAKGLDPKQLTLLDLHLRQGLESAEIADVLGVTKNNGYVMLNRLKKAVEEAIGAFIMLNDGRKYCDELDRALRAAGIAEMSPQVRKVVDRHVSACSECGERKRKMVAPLGVFAAMAPVAAPGGLKESILGEISRQWPYPPNTGSGLAPSGGSGGGGPVAPLAIGAAGEGGGRRGGLGGRTLNIAAGAGALAAVLAGLLFLPASPLAINGGGSQQTSVVPPGGDASPAVGGEGTPTATVLASTATASPSPPATASATVSATGTASATPSPSAGAGAPGGNSPTATNTNAPASTSTATSTGTPTSTNTATPTRTPTRTPTPTATVACSTILNTNVSQVNAGSGSSVGFVLLYNVNCPDTVTLTPQDSWISVSPMSFTASQDGSRTVTVFVDRSQVPAGGTQYATLRIDPGNGAAILVTVEAAGSPTPTPTATLTPTPTPSDSVGPTFSQVFSQCQDFGQGPMIFPQAVVSDPSGVAGVAYGDGSIVDPLTYDNGTWYGSAPYDRNASSYYLVARDNAGNVSTHVFTPGTGCGQ